MGKRLYDIQLKDMSTGKAITATGGMFVVTAAGAQVLATLTEADDPFSASLTQAVALSRGRIRFSVADTVNKVDIFCICPNGQFVVIPSTEEGAITEWAVDTQSREQTLIMPFDATDTLITAATERDTGMEFPTNAMINPNGMGVQVVTVDATETLDAGILSTEANGDADGFMAAISVATALFENAEIGLDVGTNNVEVDLTGGSVAEFTYGAMMMAAGTKDAKAEGGDAAGTDGNGVFAFDPHRIDGTAITLSFTTSTGTDTAAGYIHIPYRLGVIPA